MSRRRRMTSSQFACEVWARMVGNGPVDTPFEDLSPEQASRILESWPCLACGHVGQTHAPDCLLLLESLEKRAPYVHPMQHPMADD